MDDPRIRAIDVNDPLVMEYCDRVAKAIMAEFPQGDPGWDVDRIIVGASLAVAAIVKAVCSDPFMRGVTIENLAKAMRFWADVPEPPSHAH